MSNVHKILVIDDDAAMRSMIVDFLNAEGRLVQEFSSVDVAMSEVNFDRDEIDLVISDLSMLGAQGLEFIVDFKSRCPHVPVVLTTAFGTIEIAIDAINKGAFEYITKPFQLMNLGVTVNRALRFRDLHVENKNLNKRIAQSNSFSNIIGKSPGMLEIFDLIRRVSQANSNVLIMGESGTGKERVARAIHDEGPRKDKNFVAINCTAIPESLMESELFGHAKGSFTGALERKAGLFEEGDGGTIFMDEIGDMDLSLQSKLLRVIQEKKIRAVGDNQDHDVDVRIIAATHKDLKSSIKNGTFREDLYYRLSVIPIVIPPLRHRKEDIPILAEHFLRKYSLANGSNIKGFSKEVLGQLINMNWDGNVRELENIIERAVVLAQGALIELNDLPRPEEGDPEEFFQRVTAGALPTLDEIEKRYFKYVLDKTGGKKEKAAQILGVNRRTLYRKEKEYGLSNDDETVDEQFENEPLSKVEKT